MPIYSWRMQETGEAKVYYRLLDATCSGRRDYYEYCTMEKNPRYVKDLPLKRITTYSAIEKIIGDMVRSEEQQVYLLSSDYDGKATKPKELRGINMTESFKCAEEDKTIQVFIKDNDVFIKDNTFVTILMSECSHSSFTGDWNGMDLNWYAVAAWLKIRDMNTPNRPSLNKFTKEYIECMTNMLGKKRHYMDWELKAEATYDNILKILKK